MMHSTQLAMTVMYLSTTKKKRVLSITCVYAGLKTVTGIIFWMGNRIAQGKKR
jgi:hypothetical protein